MTNVNTTAINNAEKINRMQTLRAMERLMITLGGKEGMLAWLAAMPEDVALLPTGGVSIDSLMTLAASETAYAYIEHAFAAYMVPVLQLIASEGE